MNILFINNTISEFHIGCFGVSSTIIQDIKSSYSDANIVSIYTEQLKSVNFKKIINNIDNLTYDHVIINGEGSLHTKNNEGNNIFEIIRYFLEKKCVPNITLLNSSLYHIPKEWVNILQRVNAIEVRDLESQNKLLELGIDCTFKPDRLFLFLSRESYSFQNEEVNRQFLVFDAVNKNHKNIIQQLGLNELDISYGAVDLSPLTLDKRTLFSLGAVAVKTICHFYSKIIFRSWRYRKLNGKKYISNIQNDLISKILNSSNIITARYHIAVLCIYLGKSFSYLPSNTKKIEYLVKYISENFPDHVSSSEKNEYVYVDVKLKSSEIVKFINSHEYKV